MKKLIPILLLLAMLASVLMLPISAASSTVYVSDSGDDAAAGTAAAPYKTLGKALEEVSDKGTVTIVETLTLPSDFAWGSHGKSVTLTGGTLDASAVNELVLGDGVTFKSITLMLDAGDAILANGHKTTFGEGVATSSPFSVYGGGKSGSTVSSTDLTVLSGNYGRIYGGSKGGTVTGSTGLLVGGTTNASCDTSSHNKDCCVFGGGMGDTVKGSTNVTFTGSAKANYVYGGSDGAAEIGVSSNLTVSGGTAMSLYGGSKTSNDTTSNANTTITGGTFAQVFGANESAGQTGNVSLNVLGGTITRRIYGGCYNNWDFGWKSSYYVKGNVTVSIFGNANITFSASDNDRAIYAHSRQRTLSSTENTTLILADATAYSKYQGKLGTQDSAGKLLIMGNTAAADAIHYYTFEAKDGTVTEKCAYHTSHAATATLALNTSASLVYTGSPITPVTLTHSADWETEKLVVTYSNNVNVGTATASIAKDGVTASVTFGIEKAPQVKPSLTVTNETVKGKGDGKIVGLTQKMEYGTDGTTFAAVTDKDMALAPGTYYVRLAGTANYLPSETVVLTVEAGRMLKITFKAEGSPDIVRKVEWNGTLTDIPAVPVREGYTETPPVWSVTVFTDIKEDMTVDAVYTKDASATTASGIPVGTGDPSDETTKGGVVVVVPSGTTAAETSAEAPNLTTEADPDTDGTEVTTEPAENGEETTTDAEATERPAEEPTDSVDGSTEAGNEDGCGASVAASGAIVSAIALSVGVVVIRKREA